MSWFYSTEWALVIVYLYCIYLFYKVQNVNKRVQNWTESCVAVRRACLSGCGTTRSPSYSSCSSCTTMWRSWRQCWWVLRCSPPWRRRSSPSRTARPPPLPKRWVLWNSSCSGYRYCHGISRHSCLIPLDSIPSCVGIRRWGKRRLFCVPIQSHPVRFSVLSFAQR